MRIININEIENKIKTILEINEDKFGEFSQCPYYIFFVSKKMWKFIKREWGATEEQEISYRRYAIYPISKLSDDMIFFGKIYKL